MPLVAKLRRLQGRLHRVVLRLEVRAHHGHEDLVVYATVIVLVEAVEELVCNLCRDVEGAEEGPHLVSADRAVVVAVHVTEGVAQAAELLGSLGSDHLQDALELLCQLLLARPVNDRRARTSGCVVKVRHLLREVVLHMQVRADVLQKDLVRDLTASGGVQVFEEAVGDLGGIVVGAEEVPHLAAIDHAVAVGVDIAQSIAGSLKLLRGLVADGFQDLHELLLLAGHLCASAVRAAYLAGRLRGRHGVRLRGERHLPLGPFGAAELIGPCRHASLRVVGAAVERVSVEPLRRGLEGLASTSPGRPCGHGHCVLEARALRHVQPVAHSEGRHLHRRQLQPPIWGELPRHRTK
mmetsp:Transcript_49364/g.127368  ORF Transcript_49364/g.127368 Transcript_49364/m.127368 type:complete len:351 (-) Transcript_49364:102-1154(-)